MSYLSEMQDGTVVLRLHVQPKASRSRVVGLHGDRLKLAVAAPPVEGRANKAVIKYLAKLLGVAARDIAVVSGAQSRQKNVAVKTLDARVVRHLIEGSW